MTTRVAPSPNRRDFAIGLGATIGLGVAAVPGLAQIAGLEVLAAGPPGDGQDQLARAIAEGLALTKLTPRAMPVNVPRDVDAITDFVGGKRPRAGLMIVGLSTLGALQDARFADRLSACRPLARVLGEHLPVVAPATSKFRTMGEVSDAIRADTGAVVWAGRGLGSADHMLAQRVTKAVGGDVSKLAYRPFVTSAEASNEILKGKASVGTGALIEFIQQIRGGTLRAFAIASPDRLKDFDIPTLREVDVDVSQINWRGVLTRDSVGQPIIERYGEAIRRVIATPGWGELMRARFWLDMYQPAAEFEQFVKEERQRVAKLMGGVAPI